MFWDIHTLLCSFLTLLTWAQKISWTTRNSQHKLEQWVSPADRATTTGISGHTASTPSESLSRKQSLASRWLSPRHLPHGNPTSYRHSNSLFSLKLSMQKQPLIKASILTTYVNISPKMTAALRQPTRCPNLSTWIKHSYQNTIRKLRTQPFLGIGFRIVMAIDGNSSVACSIFRHQEITNIKIHKYYIGLIILYKVKC